MSDSDIGSLVVKVGMDSNLFQEGVTNLNKKMALLKSEFSATSAQLRNFGSTTDQLKNKADFLGRSVEIQEAKIKSLAQAYEKAKTETGENSKATQELGIKLNRAITDLSKLENELKQTTQQLETQSNKWTKLSTHMNNASEKMKSVGEKMANVGRTLTTALTLPILAAGTASVKLASDLAESTNKVEVAFKSSADKVEEWSNTTLQSFGIAKGSALDMAALFGDMGTAMGQSTDEASIMSMSLVGLAGDLASFKNIGIDQAQDALKGIFTGEGEALKSLGVIMQDSTLEAYALATGQKKQYDEMSQAEKVALRYSFVMDATKNSQGDFARTSTGTANQMRIFQESMKQLGATIGTHLLPLITPIIQKLNDWIIKFSQLGEGTQKTIMAITGIAAIIGPVILIVGQLISAFGAISGVLAPVIAKLSAAGGLKAALVALTGPVGIAIAAIVGLIGIFIAAYKNSEEFRNKVDTVFQQIRETISVVIENIKIIISVFIQVAKQLWEKHGSEIMSIVTIAFNLIASIIATALNLISNIIKIVTGIITGNWSQAWEGIKGVVTTVWTGISSIISNAVNLVKNTISTGLGVLTSIVDGIFNGIRNAMTSPISAAVNFISEQVSRIKGFFSNLNIQLPHIKLPHFSLAGEFSLAPPSVPSLDVNWYAKGGIFNAPSVIGVGEAGREAVLPIDRLDDLMAKAIAKVGGVARSSYNSQPLIMQVILDSKELGRAVANIVDDENGFRLV